MNLQSPDFLACVELSKYYAVWREAKVKVSVLQAFTFGCILFYKEFFLFLPLDARNSIYIGV